MTKATGKAPILQPKKDDPERGILGFTPFQAADILAYEIQKIIQLEGRRMPTRFRIPYEELDKMSGDIRLFSETAAQIQQSALMIMEYFKAHHLGSESVQ